jgi:hypothetical protein
MTTNKYNLNLTGCECDLNPTQYENWHPDLCWWIFNDISIKNDLKYSYKNYWNT